MSDNAHKIYPVFAAALLFSLLICVQTDADEEIVKQKQISALDAAIEDLMQTFGSRYPDGQEYLKRLRDIERKLEQSGQSNAEAIEAECAKLQREALISNPLVNGLPILFVVRAQYKSDHHNTATMFKTGEINTNSFQGGGALKLIDFAAGGKTKTLIETQIQNGVLFIHRRKCC